MYWTNFDFLPIFDQQRMAMYANFPIYKGMAGMNTDGKLAEQYVSFAAAREDLCMNTKVPKKARSLRAECVHYDGQRSIGWEDFPLQHYLPLRNNHMPYRTQGRRFGDVGVVNFGLSAMDFSTQVMPVDEIEAFITPKDVLGNPTWDYNHVVLRIAGWPFRIKKLGTHVPGKGNEEFVIGHQAGGGNFDEVFNFLEGQSLVALTGPNNSPELQGNLLSGQKFYAQLFELDWIGNKMDAFNVMDPDVPAEKGFVWFTVVETTTLPSTGMKAVKVELSDEGVIPAWLDLNCLQLWAGTIPLGCFNEASADGGGEVCVNRVLENEETKLKIAATTEACKIVFDDPKTMDKDEAADFGWAIRDTLYQGCTINTGPRPGKWALDVGHDEGNVIYRASAPKLVTKNVKEYRYWGFP